jgi:Stage II sporulation protein E (SpoIIE)
VKCLLDVYHQSINNVGEELCGDQIRVLNSGNKTRVVLCDGLGHGVKANILASLSSEIIINMLREDIPLPDVIETVIATLPVDKRLNLAYATSTMIEINHSDLAYKIYNFDNPPILFYRKQKLEKLPFHPITLFDRTIHVSEGRLQRGDLLVAMSDGLLHAGLDNVMNYNWGLEHLAAYVEELFHFLPADVRMIVEKTVAHTNQLYQGKPADDASMVGVLVRAQQAVMLFTGPPLNPAEDTILAKRILKFEGTRIVCGGTTGHIVGAQSGQIGSTDPDTARLAVPPMGTLPGIDIMTEGIFTLTSVLEWLDATKGNPDLLPRKDNSGSIMVASALLYADEITLLVGLQVNPSYQNPELPSSISIRKNLMEKIADRLTQMGKTVTVEFH